MEIWCARPATLMIRAAHLRAATLMNRASHLRAATLMIRASHLRAVIVIKLLRWDLICTRACSDIDDPRIIFARSDIDDPHIKFVLHDCNQIANMRLDLCVIYARSICWSAHQICVQRNLLLLARLFLYSSHMHFTKLNAHLVKFFFNHSDQAHTHSLIHSPTCSL